MDLDPEIAPLMSQMRSTLDRIEHELLPMMRALDEDTVVSHYSVDEQARLYLAAAFTMAFALYGIDKLNHRQHRSVQVSGEGGHRPLHAASAIATDGPLSADPQLLLKIERISDYIRKLREITELSKQQKGATAEGPTATGEAVTVIEDKASRKRAREGDVAPESDSACGGKSGRAPAATEGTASTEHVAEPDLGDAAMFGSVSRVPGETGVLVGRLMRHVQGGGSGSAGGGV